MDSTKQANYFSGQMAGINVEEQMRPVSELLHCFILNVRCLETKTIFKEIGKLIHR